MTHVPFSLSEVEGLTRWTERSRRPPGIALAILAALLLAPSAALACKCAEEDSNKEKYEHANVAFVGVVESAPAGDGEGGDFKVRVTKALKGVKEGELIPVSSPTSSCGQFLPKGRDVLIANTRGKDGIVGIKLCGPSLVEIGRYSVNEALKELGLSYRLEPTVTVRAGTRSEEDAELVPAEKVVAGAFANLGCDIDHEVLPKDTKLQLTFTYRKDEGSPKQKVHGAEYTREAGGIIRYTGDWHPREPGLFECEVSSAVGKASSTIRVIPAAPQK